MSVPATYFDALHAARPDPFGLRDSWYEQRKRRLLLAMLPQPRYRQAWEIGCSIGELTAALAPRCDRLLATDGSTEAIERARARTRDLPQVRVQQAWHPRDWPPGVFDLIVFSEVGYYFDAAALADLAGRLSAALAPEGSFVACHWRHPFAPAPLAGHGAQVQPLPATADATSAAATQPPPSQIGDTAGLNAVNATRAGTPDVARDVTSIDAPTPAGVTVVTPPIPPGTVMQANAQVPARVVNPSGRWRGLCTNAPLWWQLWGSPMTRLMSLALNGAQVTGSVDDVEPNVHTSVQGTLVGEKLQMAGSFGAKHDITFGADGTTLTDAWCNADGRCETCEMQRF